MTTEQLHPTVAERIEAVQQGETAELDLSGLGLSKVPEAVYRLQSLTGLNLSDNQLRPFHRINYPNALCRHLACTFGRQCRQDAYTTLCTATVGSYFCGFAQEYWVG